MNFITFLSSGDLEKLIVIERMSQRPEKEGLFKENGHVTVLHDFRDILLLRNLADCRHCGLV